MPQPTVLDRIRGCILGGALGDAFGYPIEFNGLATIRRNWGPNGLTSPQCKSGKLVVSDDTQMTLFTLEGLIRSFAQNKHPSADDIITSLRSSYLDWLYTQDGAQSGIEPLGTLAREACMQHRRAPGDTCLSSLRMGGFGTPSAPINNSKGCGAVMRTAPIGFLSLLRSNLSVFDLGCRAGALTHGHVDGWVQAGFVSDLIGRLIIGTPLREAFREALSSVDNFAAFNQLRLNLKPLFLALELSSESFSHHEAIRSIGEGWIAEEAVGIALYAALIADDFESLVQIAANHDGDSDSTAALAGQIWGTLHGFGALPQPWVQIIDVLSPLTDIMSDTEELFLPTT